MDSITACWLDLTEFRTVTDRK